ncbi:universal stress protein [Alicyclobacillus ferrooxydans]|uniref:universal stress protein n=1 Tax=Alicyclobacillus ferrooxydans TaxID=471514 RepID=UPI0006D55D3B|nr:universal stress protein [Alicyclobacillus ferrooxydans]
MAGKLKIFIGAAPGVGKTYTMLREAQDLQRQGTDVVIGYVDAYGRPDTETQITGLELVPRRQINFQGRTFEEVDVEAIVKRQPDMVIIDELAHTNAPGSQFPKRYMDVEFILDHGIGVLTTVNVQHLENAHAEAERITGVKVREIIPDEFIKRAEQVEVVDVTPETLRQRLRDGSIYPHDKVKQALNNFFRMSNLAPLRELALREVAEDVDERLQQSFDRRKIPGPVGAKENILVCVSYVDRANKLIEKASKVAARMKAELIVLTVNPRSPDQFTHKDKERIQGLKELSGQYDGRFVVEYLNDRKLPQIIIAVAERENVTQIVIGQPSKERKWRRIVKDSPVRYLLRNLKYVDLRIVGWRD